MRTAPPFDDPTALRVSPKTLRVIEMSEGISTFSQTIRKTIRQNRMFASQAMRTRYAVMQILGIPHIRITAPLSLQRTSNAQHPSRSKFAFAHGLRTATTARGLSLGMRPLIPRLRCAPPNHRSGDCKMYVNHDNRARVPDIMIYESCFSPLTEKRGRANCGTLFCVLFSLCLKEK